MIENKYPGSGKLDDPNCWGAICPCCKKAQYFERVDGVWECSRCSYEGLVKIHGQWVMNALLLEFRDEADCFHLIDRDYANILRECRRKQVRFY